MLTLNFFLAITWMTLQQSFTFSDFLVGFLLGFGIITLSQRAIREQVVETVRLQRKQDIGQYPQRVWKLLSFTNFAFWSILKANIDVARILLRPRLNINPGIIAIPLDVRSEIGITVLSNLITLTPGTVSMDVSADRSTLYVHCIDIQDPDALRDDIKQNFERRVLELFP
ncbi:Na+/H+ antiporter subunit E [Candidatus Viridilinea mediisalina]|uniref:Cation transporter n=1 Tax=Candidatus Viridilinea mediisalina TaxID=2024553 RepID=A0A2A6RL83_9CHLR|nr:Na+/H+ antiporter subunit E [Candidatus Viridilinea mediisalina]PDW03675.1 cation transporter [Candidatus Viridilinea mediisalina]